MLPIRCVNPTRINEEKQLASYTTCIQCNACVSNARAAGETPILRSFLGRLVEVAQEAFPAQPKFWPKGPPVSKNI